MHTFGTLPGAAGLLSVQDPPSDFGSKKDTLGHIGGRKFFLKQTGRGSSACLTGTLSF